MTYGDFIAALISTGLFGKNKVCLGAAIFNTSNTTNASDSAVQKWMDGSRTCNKSRYFPDDAVNTNKFFEYFKERTLDHDSWRKIQIAFSSMDESIKTAADFRVDITTDNCDAFLWSLLNQFQRIFGLIETPYSENNSAVLNTIALQTELSLENLRDVFIGYCKHYRIMGIINRKPPELTRNDATAMSNFADSIDSVIGKCKQTTDILYVSINNFKNEIQNIELILCANLNSRFNPQDPSATYNMAEDDTAAMMDTTDKPSNVPMIEDHHNSFTPSSTHTSRVKVIKRQNTRKTNNRSDNHLKNRHRQFGVPELTPEFVQAFADESPDKPDSIRYLISIGVKTWQDTINKLNNWHDDILKWKKNSQT